MGLRACACVCVWILNYKKSDSINKRRESALDTVKLSRHRRMAEINGASQRTQVSVSAMRTRHRSYKWRVEEPSFIVKKKVGEENATWTVCGEKKKHFEALEAEADAQIFKA